MYPDTKLVAALAEFVRPSALLIFFHIAKDMMNRGYEMDDAVRILALAWNTSRETR